MPQVGFLIAIDRRNHAHDVATEFGPEAAQWAKTLATRRALEGLCGPCASLLLSLDRLVTVWSLKVGTALRRSHLSKMDIEADMGWIEAAADRTTWAKIVHAMCDIEGDPVVKVNPKAEVLRTTHSKLEPALLCASSSLSATACPLRLSSVSVPNAAVGLARGNDARNAAHLAAVA